MAFQPTGEAVPKEGKGTPGTVKLLVDGEEVGRAEFPVTTPIRLGQGAQMQVGADAGSAVVPEYTPPFRFTGRLKRVIVDTSGDAVADHEAEMRIALRKQ